VRLKPLNGAFESNPLFVPRRQRLGYRKVIQTDPLPSGSLELIDSTHYEGEYILVGFAESSDKIVTRQSFRQRRVQIYRALKITNYAETD